MAAVTEKLSPLLPDDCGLVLPAGLLDGADRDLRFLESRFARRFLLDDPAAPVFLERPADSMVLLYQKAGLILRRAPPGKEGLSPPVSGLTQRQLQFHYIKQQEILLQQEIAAALVRERHFRARAAMAAAAASWPAPAAFKVKQAAGTGVFIPRQLPEIRKKPSCSSLPIPPRAKFAADDLQSLPHPRDVSCRDDGTLSPVQKQLGGDDRTPPHSPSPHNEFNLPPEWTY